MSSPSGGSPWDAVHLLSEPTRRRVYLAVRASDEPLTRDAVAATTRISRRLAAFHLDLLADAGLLATDYARPPGRSGPGAGRPAKRYRAAKVDIELSVPARRYDIAARILARAVNEAPAGDPRESALSVARDEGERIGTLRRPGGRMSVDSTLRAAQSVLADLGYEPQREPEDRVRLRNCPFHAVVDVAPQLVCGINDELIGGILSGLGGNRAVQAALDGIPPDCCVTLARR